MEGKAAAASSVLHKAEGQGLFLSLFTWLITEKQGRGLQHVTCVPCCALCVVQDGESYICDFVHMHVWPTVYMWSRVATGSPLCASLSLQLTSLPSHTQKAARATICARGSDWVSEWVVKSLVCRTQPPVLPCFLLRMFTCLYCVVLQGLSLEKDKEGNREWLKEKWTKRQRRSS